MGLARKVLALSLVTAMAVALLVVPASETDAVPRTTEVDDITVTVPSLTSIVSLGESRTVYFDLYNHNGQDRVLYVTQADYYSNIDISFPDRGDGSPGDRAYLADGDSGYFRMIITPSDNCDVGIYYIQFKFRSHDPTTANPDVFDDTGFRLCIMVVDSEGIYYAQADDVSISPSINTMEIKAGSSASLYLDIKNNLSDRSLVVYVYPDVDKEIGISYPEGQRIVLEPDGLGYCSMIVSVDKYAEEKEYEISFKIMINDPERGSVIESSASNILYVSVESDIISDDSYNHFFGFFENNLPSVFGESWFAALVTMIAFVAVAYLVGFKLVPLIGRLITKGGKE